MAQLSAITQDGLQRLLTNAASTGLLADLERRATVEHDTSRAELSAQLQLAQKTRDKGIEPAKQAMGKTEAAVWEAEARLSDAQARYSAAWRDYFAATAVADRREYKLRQQLAEIAPAVLTDTSIRLQRLQDLLRNSLRFDVMTEHDMRGVPISRNVSNLPAVNPVLEDIRQKLKALEELVYSSSSCAAITAQCESILKDASAKAVPWAPSKHKLDEALAPTHMAFAAA